MKQSELYRRSIEKLFEKFRVITWFADNRELEEQIRELELTGINKVVVDKYQSRQEPGG